MTPDAVRRLDPVLIDRIAAGEVVERPAAAVKELVENALDAGAARVEVVIEGGGRALIRVVDDGEGMSAADLALAVERHATSKLPHGDLMAVDTLGFRGEALPSIGAVARLSIASRRRGDAHGHAIVVDGGAKGPVRPVATAPGTRVEVEGLFRATPARLKFLKSDRAEAAAVHLALRRLALAHPGVRFALAAETGAGLDLPATGPGEAGLWARVAQVLGPLFEGNAVPVDGLREGHRLAGLAGLPTLTRVGAAEVHLFVNGRPVRDRVLLGALRAAYADLIARDRQPVAALFLEVPPALVDVNVHPAKTEVRFRDPGLVRGLLVGSLRDALARAGHRASSGNAERALAMLGRAVGGPGAPSSAPGPFPFAPGAGPNLNGGSGRGPEDHRRASHGLGEARQAGYAATDPPLAAVAAASGFGFDGGTFADALGAPEARAAGGAPVPDPAAHPLGAARAQLHDAYILAQTRDGLVLVDQHAAHERLVYERLKRQRLGGGVPRQGLLIPVVVDLDPAAAERLGASAEALLALGLAVAPFGEGAVAVSEVPAAVAGCDVAALVRDLADGMAEWGGPLALERAVDRVLGTFACHHSVRAGRRLTHPEMDALLREMEATPNSGQCIHGRPTSVALALKDVERLFGRR